MSMLAAQITEWGSAPKALRVNPPALPADESTVQIRVIAACLHQVARSRAEGTHYTSAGLPHTPGVDGTGIDTSTGKPVYFTSFGDGGSFVEVINLSKSSVTELPPNVDPIQAAGLMNPVLSSWMALRKRVEFLKDGQPPKPWTCFIMGATTMSGKLAIKVARQLGATRIVGAARNEEKLKTLGLDDIIVLQADPETTDFSLAGDADVVLDYLYGPYIGAFFTCRSVYRAKNPLTWVCIGSLGGNYGTVPSAGLRKRDVTIRGSGPGAWSLRELGVEIPEMLKVLEGVEDEGLRKVKLDDVESEWNSKEEGRLVFVMDKDTA